jgi:hypothetical protein
LTPLVAVTDHAAERYRQRVRGTLDPRGEILTRVGAGWAAGRTSPGTKRGSVDVRDGSLVFVCLHDRPRGELVVVTLWEEGEEAAVPRKFTDAVREPPLRRAGDSG